MAKTKISKENVSQDKENTNQLNTQSKNRRKNRKNNIQKKAIINLTDSTNVLINNQELLKFENLTKSKQVENYIQQECPAIKSDLKYIVIDGSNVAME